MFKMFLVFIVTVAFVFSFTSIAVSSDCGPQSKIISEVIPDEWRIPGTDKWVFVGNACRRHDECYGSPNANKNQCDSDFYSNLRSNCRSKLNNLTEREKKYCMKLAETYTRAVSRYGHAAFKRAQR